jgi:CheY-like chemotaxis protein
MPSILVIEDVNYLRDFYRRVLEKEGYVVREAADGVAGVEAYRQAPTDVVLGDIFLPRLGGLGVIEALRRLDPAVKVVAVSGGSDRSPGDHLELARALGAVATLAKPFGIDELLQVVRGAMGS